MSAHTKIEWCTHTWSPWIGCTRVSAACDHCYAADMAHRYGWARFETGAPRHRTSAAYWRQPYAWNRKARAAGVRESVFPSLCDPYDREVDDAWRDDFMGVIEATPDLDWLLLTKRPQLVRKYHHRRPMPRNVWLGTTAEDQKMADLRIPQLLAIDAPKRFVSLEPLLGPIDILPHLFIYSHEDTARLADETDDVVANPLPYRDPATTPPADICQPRLDWVIAGGESGPKARPSHPDWFRALRDQCAAAGVPYFFKQWGEHVPAELVKDGIDSDTPWRRTPNGQISWEIAEIRRPRPWPDVVFLKCGKKAAGALLDGQLHREFPAGDANV